MITNIWFWAVAVFLLVDYLCYIVILSRVDAVKEMDGGKKIALYVAPLLVAGVILWALSVKGLFN